MGFESQGLAFSTDAGRTWKKFARNPVLTLPTQPDFRDPKLFWHAPSARWVVVLATGDHVGIYTSRDLRHWRHESDFGAGLGAHAGVWECPDLLPLPHEGGTRWLLLVSVGEGAPNGGSGTQYFVGDFDGHTFRADAVPAARWVDYGTDDYAGSTWSGGPRGDARTLFIGWMSNWQYATRVPTSPWRSAMTLPRELSLAPGASGPSSPLRLRSLPARELQALRQSTLPIAARELRSDNDLVPAGGANGGLLELELQVQAGATGRFALRFANAVGEAVVLDVDRAAGRYTLDRHASGNVGFDAKFAGAQGAPIAAAPDEPIAIHAFIDRSSIELFLDDGLTTMTALAFPSGVFDSIRLEPASPVRVEEGALHILRSSWPQAR
jgi:fructan beta-fructosidase